MDTPTIGEVAFESSQTVFTGYAVDVAELDSLNESLKRWGHFLRKLFQYKSTRSLTPAVIDRIGMEDTERYLDVKIQLSQCITAVNDNSLKEHLDEICNEIRKNTFHFISTSLPRLNENTKCMIEWVHLHDTTASDLEELQFEGVAPPGGEKSAAYKLNMVAKRKRIKAAINRQHSNVIFQLAQLKSSLGESLYSAPQIHSDD